MNIIVHMTSLQIELLNKGFRMTTSILYEQ